MRRNELLKIDIIPNPANNLTTIHYKVPTEGNGRIEIYNMYGKKLETLMSQYIKSGKHTQELDLSNYPSGIYLCVFAFENSTFTKKIIKHF